MDRRKFLLGTTGFAGAALPLIGRGQAQPCPPPSLSVGGGTSATTQCVASNAANADADFAARAGGPGVLWTHEFSTDAEVTKFRLDKYDYGTGRLVVQTDSLGRPLVRRNTEDGVNGTGCLELFTPAGMHNNMSWCRPFVALPGDRGYTSGADLPTPWGIQYIYYRRGLYGHQDYRTNNAAAGIEWAGGDFYIQFRYKVAAASFAAQQAADTGKLAFIDLAGGGNQELVIQSPIYRSPRYTMYTNFGSRTNSALDSFQGQKGTAGSYQPGGAYDATCLYSNLGACWQFPVDEWVTLLIHVIPGHHNGNATQPSMTDPALRKDTGIQVWAARSGERNYTKIWDKLDYAWNWDASTGATVYGFNVFQPSQYMNNVASTVDWYRRFDQIIFSTQPIACPQA